MVTLPELAKPPEAAFSREFCLVISPDANGKPYVYVGGKKLPIDPPTELIRALKIRKALVESMGTSANDVTIIIRCDSFGKASHVQEIIAICHEVGFENFALRARENVRE